MKLARSLVLLAALTALAGCEGIGDGSTVVSIEIRDPGGDTITGPFPISQCLRDQMIAIATFTDGTRADFSYRVQWTSSDPAVVQVSNDDILQSYIDDGAFTTLEGFTYRPGTLVPVAAAGASATVTASFLGMSSSKTVVIMQPTLRVAPVKDIDPMQAPATAYLGPATIQRFGFYVEQEDGHVLLPTSLNLLGSLNPVLWSFEGGEFDPADTAVAGDFDKVAVPNAASPTATITGAGVVRGVTPEDAVYTVRATTSLCENDPAFTPTATIRVAPFATDALTLQHEPDINGEGVASTGDLIAGTGEVMTVLGNLDTDGDPATAEQTQDLGDQIDVAVTHTQSCVSGTDSHCVCDANGDNCSKQLLSGNGAFVFSLISDDGETATAQACFTNIDTLHSDDCEEVPASGSEFQLFSNVLALQVVPVERSAGNATTFVRPAAAAQRAFAYPGQQFHAYGTFTALAGTPFAGGTSATATQKITRNVTWTTRQQGSTTEFPEFGFVRNTDDGYFGHIGSFTYVDDVAANTAVDVNFTLGIPFVDVTPPASPVPFTVCPSTAGTCP